MKSWGWKEGGGSNGEKWGKNGIMKTFRFQCEQLILKMFSWGKKKIYSFVIIKNTSHLVFRDIHIYENPASTY